MAYFIALAVLAVLIYRLRHIHYNFVVQLQSGKVQTLKGYVPNAYIQSCRQLMRGRKLYGKVKGRYIDGEMVLSFSKSISDQDQYKLRTQFPYHLFDRNGNNEEPEVSLD